MAREPASTRRSRDRASDRKAPREARRSWTEERKPAVWDGAWAGRGAEALWRATTRGKGTANRRPRYTCSKVVVVPGLVIGVPFRLQGGVFRVALGDVVDERFGRENERRDRGRVLERVERDRRGVDNAGGEQVLVPGS